MRGGSWFDNPQDIRMACRVGNTADFRDKYIGFRIGRTLAAGAGAITSTQGERH